MFGSSLCLPLHSAQAQSAQPSAPRVASQRPWSNSIAVMGGLSQPILFRGTNVEVEYLTNRFVLGWSHGIALRLDNFESALESADRAENISLRMPWTTGPSLGYRLTNRLSATVDLKAHRVRAGLPGGSAASYTVYTVGPALSYIQPLGKHWFVTPMVRWWPTAGTSLDGDETPLRRADGSSYRHQAVTLGVVPNIKFGFRF